MKSLLLLVLLGNALSFVVSGDSVVEEIKQALPDVLEKTESVQKPAEYSKGSGKSGGLLTDVANESGGSSAKESGGLLSKGSGGSSAKGSGGSSAKGSGGSSAKGSGGSSAKGSGGSLANVANEVKETLSNTAGGVSKAAGVAANVLGNKASELETVVEKGEKVANSIDLLSKGAVTYVENIVSQAGKTIEKNVDLVGDLAKEVEKSVNYIGQGMKIVGTIVDKNKGGIKDTFNELTNAVRYIGKGVDAFDEFMNSVLQEKESLTQITLHVVGNAGEENLKMKEKKTVSRSTRETKRRLKIEELPHGTQRSSEPMITPGRPGEPKFKDTGNTVGSARDTGGFELKLPELRQTILKPQDRSDKMNKIGIETSKNNLENKDRIIVKEENISAGKRRGSKIHPMIFVGEPIAVDQIFEQFDDDNMVWCLDKCGGSENRFHENKNQSDSKNSKKSYMHEIDNGELKRATKTEICKIDSEVKCKGDRDISKPKGIKCSS